MSILLLIQDADPVNYTVSPSGGVVLSGIGVYTKTNVFPASGSVTGSGTAAITFASGSNSRTYTPSGTVTLASGAPLIKNHISTPTGTVVFASSAQPLHSRLQVVSGVVVFSGAATLFKTNVVPASGVVTMSGNSPITLESVGSASTRLALTSVGI